MLNRVPLILMFFLLVACLGKAYAQPSWTIDLLRNEEKKPKQYEDKQLGSEKSAEKKFTLFRRFVQNTITHFNYYYDANNKVNLVIEKATLAHKDDYTKLLPFYPYTPKTTAASKTDLDSVILKCTAAILLHDLRNDWIDNMYLLLGKAYFLRNDLDSAEGVFQFINYNLFPRKKDEDDNRVIGTNRMAANGTLSIADKERLNIFQKIASQPPSRNDALVWLTRTLVEEGNYEDASGLIHTLLADPNLPARLRDDMEEVYAYYFYRQYQYDSTAKRLELALSNAPNKADRARREFLLAQLYELTHAYTKASFYYKEAEVHTVDPLMDIYAQVNNAKMLKSREPGQLDIGIGNLLQMAKRDKFELYRGILYYSAGQLAMQKPDTASARSYYAKAYANAADNITLANQSLLELGEIAYNQHDYKKAYAYYDSLGTGDSSLNARLDEIHSRRNMLEKIVTKENIIDREDSLQRIAALPQDERLAFVKKLSKKLNKDQRASSENEDFGQTSIDFGNATQTDLFASGASTKNNGEWYFYNAAAKSQGYNDFKSKWGTRPDADNWNRKAALDQAKAAADNPNLNVSPGAVFLSPDSTAASQPAAVKNDVLPKDQSVEGLLKDLPLTPEKLAASNHLICENLYELAKVFQDEKEDYPAAIATYKRSLLRYPDSLHNGDIYLGLYYCYLKLGNHDSMAYYKQLLGDRFPKSDAASMVAQKSVKAAQKDPAATAHYQVVYNLFIEGRYEEAVKLKTNMDSLYGTSYWSPQLLYIETVYYLRVCQDDSGAVRTLKQLLTLFPTSSMRPKAERLLSVLSRRAEIERYLTNLKITRAVEDTVVVSTERTVSLTAKPQGTIPAKTDSLKSAADTLVKKDSIQAVPAKSATPHEPSHPVISADSAAARKDSSFYVVMVLEKVDYSYAVEARNAITRYNDEYYYGQKISAASDTLDASHSLIVIASFRNIDLTLTYYQKLKSALPDEISWLPAEKYSLLFITDKSLKQLKADKNLPGYRSYLNTLYPGKL